MLSRAGGCLSARWRVAPAAGPAGRLRRLRMPRLRLLLHCHWFHLAPVAHPPANLLPSSLHAAATQCLLTPLPTHLTPFQPCPQMWTWMMTTGAWMPRAKPTEALPAESVPTGALRLWCYCARLAGPAWPPGALPHSPLARCCILSIVSCACVRLPWLHVISVCTGLQGEGSHRQ